MHGCHSLADLVDHCQKYLRANEVYLALVQWEFITHKRYALHRKQQNVYDVIKCIVSSHDLKTSLLCLSGLMTIYMILTKNTVVCEEEHFPPWSGSILIGGQHCQPSSCVASSLCRLKDHLWRMILQGQHWRGGEMGNNAKGGLASMQWRPAEDKLWLDNWSKSWLSVLPEMRRAVWYAVISYNTNVWILMLLSVIQTDYFDAI